MVGTEKPLIEGSFLLKKMPGKGGWTYTDLPGVAPDKHAHFGWVRVKGSIDGFAIEKYHLLPYGGGKLFLPVKAAIRKKIGKEAGDEVRVVLYRDEAPDEVPEDLLLCLEDAPEALAFFNTLSTEEQSQLIRTVNTAKSTAQREDRMAAAINALAAGRRSTAG